MWRISGFFLFILGIILLTWEKYIFEVEKKHSVEAGVPVPPAFIIKEKDLVLS